MFTMKIKTEGSAFCDPFEGRKDEYCKQEEVLRILKEIVADMEVGMHVGKVISYKTLRDLNGNIVGEYKLK